LGIVANTMELVIEPTLEQEIYKGQLKDEKLKKIAEDIVIGKSPGFRMDDNGILWFGKRSCVYMEFQRRLCLIEVRSLRHTFGRLYMNL
jgi:hypothetical protein